MKIIALMYHDVYQNVPSESGFQNYSAFQYKISAKEFKNQIIAINKYYTDNHLDKSSIEFTFDDGGESFISVIAPILEKYDLKGIFFISTKYIDTDKFLSTKQIKELHDRGHIIGSHSHTHPNNLAILNKNEITNEWRNSITILSKIIGEPIIYASIPNGYGSEIITETAHYNGIKYMYTSIPSDKRNKYNEMSIIGRYVIHDKTTLENVVSIISDKNAREKLYYKWKIISFVKFILGSNYNKLKRLILKNKAK